MSRLREKNCYIVDITFPCDKGDTSRDARAL